MDSESPVNKLRGRGYVTKAYLRRVYKISHKVLQLWLNEKYFEDLRAAGYEKNQVGLTPKQIEVLIDKVGEP